MHTWHQSQWLKLIAVTSLHHGLMITGADGIGKREFCLELVRYLLCNDRQSGAENACGNCQSCDLFKAGTHPDFHLLASETESVQARVPLISAYGDRYQNVIARDKKAKPGKIISIDQIRQLIERFSTQSHISSNTVVLIMPADSMNSNAANALLKLLEEPPGSSTLILMTAFPGFLPATIKSRCMMVTLPSPDKEVSLDWLTQFMDKETATRSLDIANGRPLNAKLFVDSGFLETQLQYMNQLTDMVASRITPLALAADLGKSDLATFLEWFQGLICELIEWRVAHVEPRRFNPNDRIWSARSFSVEKLYALYDRICFYRGIVREPINVQLATEDLILMLKSAVR